MVCVVVPSMRKKVCRESKRVGGGGGTGRAIEVEREGEREEGIESVYRDWLIDDSRRIKLDFGRSDGCKVQEEKKRRRLSRGTCVVLFLAAAGERM